MFFKSTFLISKNSFAFVLFIVPYSCLMDAISYLSMRVDIISAKFSFPFNKLCIFQVDFICLLDLVFVFHTRVVPMKYSIP